MKIVERLIRYYDCSLEQLINILENTINSDDNIENMGMPILDEETYRRFTNDKSGNFIGYKISRSFLCAKSIRLLLSFQWLDNFIPDINNTKSDIPKVQLLCNYFEEHKYSNGIQHYIDCMKNINDTITRKISITKGIINRYDRINDVFHMNEALSSIFEGVETLFVPNCICEAYIPYCLKMESETIYQKIIKKKLEAVYRHPMKYYSAGAPFKIDNGHISDLILRNCYYYLDEMNQLVEIYVENISLSLSAMVRVATLVNELMDISVQTRNCTVICLVDNVKEMEQFDDLLIYINTKYNKSANLKIPVLYLLNDRIKEGKLLRCKSYRLYDEQ